jgi:hypothetical protein
MENVGNTYPVCQRQIVVTKTITTLPIIGGGTVPQVTICIDGMMDFSLNELSEVLQLLNATYSDIKLKLYGTRKK